MIEIFGATIIEIIYLIVGVFLGWSFTQMYWLIRKKGIELKVVCLYCDYPMEENLEMKGVHYCPNCEESVSIEVLRND